MSKIIVTRHAIQGHNDRYLNEEDLAMSSQTRVFESGDTTPADALRMCMAFEAANIRKYLPTRAQLIEDALLSYDETTEWVRVDGIEWRYRIG